MLEYVDGGTKDWSVSVGLRRARDRGVVSGMEELRASRMAFERGWVGEKPVIIAVKPAGSVVSGRAAIFGT